ncbi:LysE family translocator [Paeniroseomonas aquatica]|uniref:LysE family translocator n=2 Tax=Paeniroseomonas aquatica TaxID=373043 RepID=A0ABT8A9C1_9PROT|nr:LysE family translocator [Paeniroseomonas aquatica]MDN3566129.1 LysE family translocator [Paeniroseomonas aquatica]
MDAAWLASATGFALAMTASPGPNNAMVAASAANFGLRRSLPHVLGIALGFPAMLVLVAFGLAEVLAASPALQAALRWVGTAWMLWLAWKIATAAPATAEAPRRGRPMTLVQAALFQWVNPKAWIIAGGAILTYGRPWLMAVLFALTALVSLLAWAALGLGTARLLRTPAALRRFNWAMAALLVLSLVPVLLG